MSAPPRVLLVTGLSGAGRTTTLRMLEDLEWEAIDNLPVRLLERLLEASEVDGSLAIGLDSRTRGFDAGAIVALAKKMSARSDFVLGTLFLECDDAELQRRYNETRRRHPMAGSELRGRPVSEAIGAERATTAPLKRWAETVIDTTALTVPDLQQTIRERFGSTSGEPLSLTISSFGFARGMPPLADLVFDMRFLANPHWNEELRPLTGCDAEVGEYIAADPRLCRGVRPDRRVGRASAAAIPRAGARLPSCRAGLYRGQAPVGLHCRAHGRSLARTGLFAHHSASRSRCARGGRDRGFASRVTSA